MCVCICICVSMYMYMHLHVYMYMYIYRYVYIYIVFLKGGQASVATKRRKDNNSLRRKCWALQFGPPDDTAIGTNCCANSDVMAVPGSARCKPGVVRKDVKTFNLSCG